MKQIILVFLLLISFLAEAEESERGRLADGRAYRTDSAGTQLVDYIAELELTVEEKERTIVSLKNELKKLKSTKIESPIIERDLVSDFPQNEALSYKEQLLEKNKEIKKLKETIDSFRYEIEVYQLREKQNKDLKFIKDTQANPYIVQESTKIIKTRNSAFSQLSSNLNISYNNLVNKVKQRDDLFRQYNNSKQKKVLAFKLSSLKTKNNKNYSSIKTDIDRAENFSQLSEIQKELLTLTKVVNSDIVLLQKFVSKNP